MMLKKVFSVFLATLFLLLPLAHQNIFAQEEFTTDVKVVYDISEKGIAHTTYSFSLTNNFSNLYATGYSLSLTGIEPINIRASQEGHDLPVETEKKDKDLVVKLNFPDSVVGKDKTRNFSISFDDATIAAKSGEVWEISIPKIANPEIFKNYLVFMYVPLSLGKEAYVSPQPSMTSYQGNKTVYEFSKEAVKNKGVSAAFGQFQVFSFDLTYHLENPLAKNALIEIALPPDTAFQKVNYQKLDPAPAEVTIDPDGNWIATYQLKSRERVDVKAQGVVQIFSEARYKEKISQEQIAENTKPSEVWQTQDPLIIQEAKKLKNVRQIYDYVTRILSYDYERVRPNVERLGAREALRNPKLAICMEFTDAFIALARANGIPAREINGYAYTENRELQPLSLVADVLHAWPEYWDSEKSIWVPIDPTWGSTTGGEDFFSKLDLRHFTFVIHGSDPNKPFPAGSYKLGANPQKDIYVGFGQLPEKRLSQPTISLKTAAYIPFTPTKVYVDIKNPGPVAIDNKDIEVFFDNQKVLSQNISVLPPFAKTSLETKIPFSLLGRDTPNKLTVSYAGESAFLPTPKVAVIITSLGSVFLAIFVIVLLLFTRARKHDQGKKTPHRQTTS